MPSCSLRPWFVSFGSPFANSLAAAALAAASAVAAVALPNPARGAIVVDASGTSAVGTPVAFRATLALEAETLTIDLENVSPVPTSQPAEVLTSFFFDVRRAGSPAALAYLSAVGQVYQVLRLCPDDAVIYTPPAKAGGKGSFEPGLGLSDLMATKDGDLTWQFRQLDPAFEPLAGFGLGTVGNSELSPNNFNPKIVDGNDFAIYRGDDIEPKGNLPGRLLVKDRARFTFGIGPGWKETDVGHRFAFGLGTSPDSLIVVMVDEPAAGPGAALAASALAGLCTVAHRRRQAARRAGRTGGIEPAAGSASAGSASAADPPACRPISRETNTAI